MCENRDFHNLFAKLDCGGRDEKKNALEELRNMLDSYNTKDVVDTELQMYIFKCLNDQSEVVRECTIKLIQTLLTHMKTPLNHYHLTYLIRALTDRIGTEEIREDSEELRLQLVKLLHFVITEKTHCTDLKPFSNDLGQILQQTIQDKHPQMKELSCKCIQDVASILEPSECILKLVLKCCGHQRYKIRIEGIQAVGEYVLYNQMETLNMVLSGITERLFDEIPLVRMAVLENAFKWLTQYRDRYSCFHKLLPLILAGLHDDCDEICTYSRIVWKKVGVQYSEENENDLKQQLDFEPINLENYPVNFTGIQERPILGCRILVQRNIGKLVGALRKELLSWQIHVKYKSVQLLYELVLHSEEFVTQHLQNLLPAMYSVLVYETNSSPISNYVLKASEIIAYFVPITIWTKFILSAIGFQHHLQGILYILASLLNGTKLQESTQMDLIENITSVLASRDICFTRNQQILNALYTCSSVLNQKLDKNLKGNPKIAYHLYKLHMVLRALRDENPSTDDHLPIVSSKDSLDQLLMEIDTNPDKWHSTSPEKSVFEVILLDPNVYEENLEGIQTILIKCLRDGTDDECKLKILLTLVKNLSLNIWIILSTSRNWSQFVLRLIQDVLKVLLMWKPGSAAQSLRTMSCITLYHLLKIHINAPDQLFPDGNVLQQICDDLLPLLYSQMEDEAHKSRENAIECLGLFKQYMYFKHIWTIDHLIQMYTNCFKRFDDPVPNIRLIALKITPLIFCNCPEQFQSSTFQTHHELIIDTLLIHLVDEDVFEQIIDIFKVVGTINGLLLKRKLEDFKQNILYSNEKFEYITNLINLH